MTVSSQIKDWFSFAKANYKYFFFTSLFFSLLAAQLYFNSIDSGLHQFIGRSMGEATIKGIDVGKRTFAFYSAGALFLVGNFVLYFIFYSLFKKQNDLRWLQLPNVLSMIGAIMIFFTAMDYTRMFSVHLILGLVICALIFVLVKKKLISEPNSKLFDHTLFTYLNCFSFFLFFSVKEVFSINISLVFFLPATFIFLLACVVLYVRKYQNHYLLNTFERTAYALFPLSLLPLCSVLKTEIYLITAGKGILFPPPLIYFFLLVVVIGYLISRVFFLRKGKQMELISELLYKRYLPFLILGLGAFVYYEPFYMNTSTELFERANRFLPVIEFYKYDVIPMVQKFNSHMLSDFVTIYLYSIFNKMEGMAPLIYDFIFPSISALITFAVIRDLTRNHFVALFIVLLFPFTEQLIPLNFSPALIGIYMLKKFIYGKQDLKAHLWFLLGVFFLMIWRIDIGVGSIFALVLVLLSYRITKQIKFSLRRILQSMGIFLLVILVISIILHFREINILTTANDYLSHISANQSYGFSALVSESDLVTKFLFNLHHYVFPITVLAIFIYILFNLQEFSSVKKTRLTVLCILFCIGFYLGNFQRGLVRHGFMEHTDLYLSSFVFLIFGGSVYLFFSKKRQSFKFVAFVIVIFLLITGFKHGEFSAKSLICEFSDKKLENLEVKLPLKREINPEMLEKKYKPFKDFVDAELDKDETFIDFSNTPMFYYFTGKQTPSFFFQNPICMHNDHLQNRFLEDLKNYKTPIVLFSRSHQNDDQWGWDYMDFVPNALRHYRIAEYLYTNYEPFTIVKDHCVWRKKGRKFSKPDSLFARDHYSSRFQKWEMGMIPYLWATYDKNMKTVQVQKKLVEKPLVLGDSAEFEIPKGIDLTDGNYVFIQISCKNDKTFDLKLKYGRNSGEFDFYCPPGEGMRRFAVRISAQYNWYAKSNRRLVLSANTKEKIYLEKMSILRGN